MRVESGLALVEILLALFISALLAVIGIGMTRQSLAAAATAQRLIDDVEEMRTLQSLIASDLTALTSEAHVRDHPQAGEPLMSFMRSGGKWTALEGRGTPPYAIAYFLSDGIFYRQTDGGPRMDPLMTGLDGVEVEFLGAARSENARPGALAVFFTTRRWGRVRVVFALGMASGQGRMGS